MHLRAHPSKLHDVRVVELPEVEDVRLGPLLDLLDGDQLLLPAADEDDALRPRAQPLLVQDRFEGNFPFVCKAEGDPNEFLKSLKLQLIPGSDLKATVIA